MTLKVLDQLGPSISLLLEPSSRQLVLALQTELGTVSIRLSQERACQLGVSLIRESGKVWTFTEAAAPETKEKDDEVDLDRVDHGWPARGEPGPGARPPEAGSNGAGRHPRAYPISLSGDFPSGGDRGAESGAEDGDGAG